MKSKKLYLAVINKVYALSYLNVGYPTEFRLPNFYLMNESAKSNSIFYTPAEVKILKEKHPEAVFIERNEINNYFIEIRCYIENARRERMIAKLLESQLN